MNRIYIITFLVFSFCFSIDCNDQIEVELWNECYSINETTELYLTNNNLIGEIPSEIGET